MLALWRGIGENKDDKPAEHRHPCAAWYINGPARLCRSVAHQSWFQNGVTNPHPNLNPRPRPRPSSNPNPDPNQAPKQRISPLYLPHISPVSPRFQNGVTLAILFAAGLAGIETEPQYAREI